MIVRERADEFVMIEQHHHGAIAGQLFTNLNKILLPETTWINAIHTAITYHDCGWIPLDSEPFWDDEKKRPFSFSDLPIGPKIILYEFGINEVERLSPYAALLCSIHYVSFLTDRTDTLTKQFVRRELSRQKKIKESLQLDDHSVHQNYRYLKLFDDLSLYICLNEPNTSKDKEHIFFKSGIVVPDHFPFHKLQLHWQNDEIMLQQPMFREEVIVNIKQRIVSKKAIKRNGLVQAYKDAVVEDITVTLKSGE